MLRFVRGCEVWPRGSQIRRAVAQVYRRAVAILGLCVVLCAALAGSTQLALAQFAQQGPKLVGTGGVGNSRQGVSVSVSADGNTAIFGGCCDDGGAGAVWVFTRSGGVWTQQGSKLVGTGAIGPASQGYSVSLSADGNTALVGGPADDGNTGAAWVFTRSGGVWAQQGSKLVGTGAVGVSAQGVAVSLSADGNTAVVGGPGDDGDMGAAWVFTRSGGVWTQQGAKLVGTGASGAANQGVSVAVSGDSNTAIVGGFSDDAGVGAAWVFARSGGVWTQEGAKLVGSGAIGDSFQGLSVSLSSDGVTAIVGGPADDLGLGAAWVFTRSAGVWTEQAKLFGTGGISTMAQGTAVSLSGDGNTALVGGPEDNVGAGAAWVFVRSGTVWSQLGMKLVGSGVSGHGFQSASASLSADGTMAIVGAPFDAGDRGAAVVYQRASPEPLPPLACASSSRLGDFNGDGKADLLFRRNDGLVSVVSMNGLQAVSAALVGQIGVEWTLVGIGDFNGDGKSDLLMRRTDGTIAIYLMNGASVQAAQLIGNIGNEWKVVGAGDVNGDGRADILARRTDGLLALYLMNGFQVLAAQVIGIVGMEWTVAQVADLNGDGRADFLMRRSDGAVAVYLMNGFQVVSATVIGTIGTEWRVIAAADFNGDARADFMTRRTDGALAVYLMNGALVLAAQTIGSIGLEWGFVGTGDFNADGRGDLLFRRLDGTTSAHLVDGFQIIVADQLNVGAEWASCYGEGGGGVAVVASVRQQSSVNAERVAQTRKSTHKFCSAQ